MRTLLIFGILLTSAFAVRTSFGQGTVTVNLPGQEEAKTAMTAEEKKVFDRSVLPKIRSKLRNDVCEESVDISGVLRGSFTKPAAAQTLVFYQFCQSGNGLGSAGVAIIENGRVAANYVAPEAAWTLEARKLPDIDQNGLDEAVLYWSGGMHQGAGGSGADIWEFSAAAAKGIGWFQAESFDDRSPVTGWKVTAQPAPRPRFFREKYTQTAAGKWRRSGRVLPFKLDPAVITFSPLK